MNRTLRQRLDAIANLSNSEAAGGVVLLCAAAVALAAANSPWATSYAAVLAWKMPWGSGTTMSVQHVVNDGLMAVFFLVVGLELKRELVEGHLSHVRKAALPAFAALGGMAVPALIYLAIARRAGPQALRGWAVPTATDIAFALGCLAILGRRVPPTLKAFLLSVAVFDDLGAIVIIAFCYTDHVAAAPLMIAGAVYPLLAVMNRRGVRNVAAYLIVGVGLWAAVLASGVHATIAGATLAMFIPLMPGRRDAGEPLGLAPLTRLEGALRGPVAFGVLPLFALANAGVPLAGTAPADLLAPVPLAILAGLCLGKPIGIVSSCWLATRCHVARLPEGVAWAALSGVAILCGIGFTMSLFIASLAFDPAKPGAATDRLALLLASAVAGVVGTTLCAVVLRPAGAPTRQPSDDA